MQDTVSDVFEALAHPTRRQILQDLKQIVLREVRKRTAKPKQPGLKKHAKERTA